MTFASPHAAGERPQAAALPDFVLSQFDHDSAEHDHRQLYRILAVSMTAFG